MKKFIVLSFFTFLSSIGFSQVTYGVKAGVGISNIVDVHGQSVSRTGFQAGGFATIPLSRASDQFYLQPEILYWQGGERNDGDAVETIFKLDYIAVPVLFKFYLSDYDDELFLEAGPQFAFLVSDKVENQIFNNEEYNSFDFSLNFGLGYTLYREWEINMRYTFGLSDVVDGDARNSKNRSSNLQFGLAYRF